MYLLLYIPNITQNKHAHISWHHIIFIDISSDKMHLTRTYRCTRVQILYVYSCGLKRYYIIHILYYITFSNENNIIYIYRVNNNNDNRKQICL